jgi:hypothetical protein
MAAGSAPERKEADEAREKASAGFGRKGERKPEAEGEKGQVRGGKFMDEPKIQNRRGGPLDVRFFGKMRKEFASRARSWAPCIRTVRQNTRGGGLMKGDATAAKPARPNQR